MSSLSIGNYQVKGTKATVLIITILIVYHSVFVGLGYMLAKI